MRKAKVIYNGNEDKYEIQINTGDGWGLDTAYKCVAKENSKTGNADFIHFSIISKLYELEQQGYSITFKYL